MHNVHAQYTCKYGVVFGVKLVNKAYTNVLNGPLNNSTYNVTVDSGKQLAIRDNVLM